MRYGDYDCYIYVVPVTRYDPYRYYYRDSTLVIVRLRFPTSLRFIYVRCHCHFDVGMTVMTLLLPHSIPATFCLTGELRYIPAIR